MYEGSEKRKYKRIKQQFIVKMREKTVGAEWDMLTTKNLSAGGVLLNYDRKPAVGSLVEMEINFPIIDEPVDCTGRVNRIEQDADSPIIRFAAVFTEIEAKTKEVINVMAEKVYLRKPERID